ncbi:MAG: radical SAM protein [Bacteroidales bacterium]|nr:radical SAM protein [Bacteroidales bacterium]
MNKQTNKPAPFIGISRHRLATDGVGVTTLAAFWGCPLRCAYCLNPHSLSVDAKVQHYTPQELYDAVKIDNLYFAATGGGITFGGGEPCLYPDFIAKFREMCGAEWTITMETSLNVPFENIEKLVSVVDYWIVDCKDLNPETYEKYTKKSNLHTITNLKFLIEQGKSKKIRVRVPRIENYNTETDIETSVSTLHEMGLTDIEIFTYNITRKKNIRESKLMGDNNANRIKCV